MRLAARVGAMTVAFLSLAWAGDGPPCLWILPFENMGASSSSDYLQDALPALLAVAVSRSDEHVVVDREHLNHVLEEQSLTLAGLTSPDARQRAGKILGATILISGSFLQQGGELRVIMRAADLETGIVTAAAEAGGPSGQPGELVTRLYRKLAANLARRLPELTPDQIDPAPLANLHFIKGLGQYYGARYNHALAEFLLAGEEERLTGISRLWLANTYLAQQQFTHAYLELNRLIHSGSIPDKEVSSKLKACERHLSPDDRKRIREMAARTAPVKE